MNRPSIDLWLYLGLLVPLVGVLGLSFVVTPEDIETGRIVLSPECLMKRWLGHDCPTCGLTRAFTALSHARLGDAIGFHVASPVVYAGWWLLTIWVARSLFRTARRLRWRAA